MLKVGAVRRTPPEDDHWECTLDLSQTLLSVPLPFANFSLGVVTVIDQNPGFDGFSEFHESFQQIMEPGSVSFKEH